MKKTLLLLFVFLSYLLADEVSAYWVGRPGRRPLAPLHMSGSGYATTLEGKQKTIEKVKGLLESSELIFAIPASSVRVPQAQKLRQSMPPGTTVTVIKNKLMARAVEGTPYQAAGSLLKGANMWFFIEEDIAGTIKAYNDFVKETQKKDTHPILGGVADGTVYDYAGIDAISKLPSKQELIARIAGSIKMVPTKVARVIKAPNTKLARTLKEAAGAKLVRAIKLATTPEETN